MKYSKKVILKNGMECYLRNATESDGQLVLDNFRLTHTETDYLLTYPDENNKILYWEDSSHYLGSEI